MTWPAAHDVESNLIKVKLEKGDRTRAFGTRVVDTEIQLVGLMIVRISEKGAMSEWNAHNPSAFVAPGDSIVEANGHTEPWAIMAEMVKAMTAEMVVRRATPRAMAFLADCEVTDRDVQTTGFLLKRTVSAGDVSADACAICLEDFEADEQVAGLQCGHSFHQRCLRRWLMRRGTASCPLCRETVR